MQKVIINNNNEEHSLVYGLGSGFVYACGGAGKWKENLPNILNSFGNSVLISTVDIPIVAAEIIYNTVGQSRLYLDSGGFTLYKKEKELGTDNLEFQKLCLKMKNKFLKLLSLIKVKECFELDNEFFRVDEDLLSPLNYCREEIKAVSGFYPTPVFKMHQGFEYWKRLCESDLYPKLSIGGLAATREWGTRTEELALMMQYARQCGKKVHCLGMQNVQGFKQIQPDTVDYSIFQYAINLQRAKKEHPELLEYADLKKHTVLYALSAANSRSFLYDCYKIGDGIEEAEDAALLEGIKL